MGCFGTLFFSDLYIILHEKRWLIMEEKQTILALGTGYIWLDRDGWKVVNKGY